MSSNKHRYYYSAHSDKGGTMMTLMQSHIFPCLFFMDVLAYLNKPNLVISFLQIEFLRGFKWANYERCHGRECSNYQQCGEKWVWRQTRGTRGFEDVGRLMHFHTLFIKSLFFSSLHVWPDISFSFVLVRSTRLRIPSCSRERPSFHPPARVFNFDLRAHWEAMERREIMLHCWEIKKGNAQNTRRGRDWVGRKKNKKRQDNKERTGTSGDCQRENKNKGAGERRRAEWWWLGGGAHSNEQVVGGREG